MVRHRFRLVVEFVYRRRHTLRIAGLGLLIAGLGVAIGLDAAAGLVLVGAAALLLACSQPLLLAHLRYRQARRQAPHNGHGPRVDDLDSF
jgi:predicted Kef-type K+ transport protein